MQNTKCHIYKTVQVLTMLLLCLPILPIYSQVKPKRVASIPFEMVGSYVVVPVSINNSKPLSLILDAGIRNTIVTELQTDDAITLNYSSVRDLMGLGGGNHLDAYTSDNNTLQIGKIKLTSKTVYVLQDTIFGLSRHAGRKLNGLIGIDFFKDYCIEINYSSRKITFYQPELFDIPKGYSMLPITTEGQKLFVDLVVLNADSSKQNVKMLIDTGAELNAWFQTSTSEAVHLPQKWVSGIIGEGLNGTIVGKFGQIPAIWFGEHCIHNPIVAFPDSVAISGILQSSKRDGTVGSQLLSRFNLFIDYKNKRLLYKPNENFKKPFTYNVAGLEIIQCSTNLPLYEVSSVWPNSPAEMAGVRVGDMLLEIDGQKTLLMTLGDIRKILEKTSKNKLNLKLMRDIQPISVKVDMTNKI